MRRIAINRNPGSCPTYPAIPDGTSFATRPGVPQVTGEQVGVVAPAGTVLAPQGSFQELGSALVQVG